MAKLDGGNNWNERILVRRADDDRPLQEAIVRFPIAKSVDCRGNCFCEEGFEKLANARGESLTCVRVEGIPMDDENNPKISHLNSRDQEELASSLGA